MVATIEAPHLSEELACLAVALDRVRLELAAQLGTDLELQGHLPAARALREIVVRLDRLLRRALPLHRALQGTDFALRKPAPARQQIRGPEVPLRMVQETGDFRTIAVAPSFERLVI